MSTCQAPMGSGAHHHAVRTMRHCGQPENSRHGAAAHSTKPPRPLFHNSNAPGDSRATRASASTPACRGLMVGHPSVYTSHTRLARPPCLTTNHWLEEPELPHAHHRCAHSPQRPTVGEGTPPAVQPCVGCRPSPPTAAAVPRPTLLAPGYPILHHAGAVHTGPTSASGAPLPMAPSCTI